MSNNKHKSELISLINDLMSDIVLKPLHPKSKHRYSRYALSISLFYLSILAPNCRTLPQSMDYREHRFYCESAKGEKCFRPIRAFVYVFGLSQLHYAKLLWPRVVIYRSFDPYFAAGHGGACGGATPNIQNDNMRRGNIKY